MKNKQYLEKREQWRAMIRQRDDRSEIVNYDDPSFPSYSFEGHMDGSSPWIRKVHWHEDVEMMSVLTGKMAYNINGSIVEVSAGDTLFINSRQMHYSTDVDNTYCTYIITMVLLKQYSIARTGLFSQLPACYLRFCGTNNDRAPPKTY